MIRTVLILASVLLWISPAGFAHCFSSASQENDRIVPGDDIEVQIEDAPELSKTYRVNASGTFVMRYVGAITAQQRTPKELAAVISDGLRGRYLKEPRVSVRVIRFSGPVKNLLAGADQYYFIQGAVRNPGVYRIEGRASLTRIIELAGGLTSAHGPIAYILRPRIKKDAGNDQSETTESEYVTTNANIDRLLKGATSEDVTLERGDVVNIPATRDVFVTGEVGAPGSFQFKKGMTLLDAIGLARGLAASAIGSKAVIFREDQNTGRRTEIKVDITAITSRKSKDVALQLNDIIIVPSSRSRTTNPLRFLDSPPVPPVKPCRKSGPCIAQKNRTKAHIESLEIKNPNYC